MLGSGGILNLTGLLKVNQGSNYLLSTTIKDTDAGRVITGITQANPGVVTCAAHGLSSGAQISITGVLGMTEINSQLLTVTVINPNSFSVGINTSAYGAYVSGGTFGVVYNFSTGWTAIARFRRNVDSLITLTLTSATAGGILLAATSPNLSISISGSKSSLLTWALGMWWLEMTGPDAYTDRLLHGTVEVSLMGRR